MWPTSNLTSKGRDGLLAPGAFYAGQEPGLDNPGIVSRPCPFSTEDVALVD